MLPFRMHEMYPPVDTTSGFFYFDCPTNISDLLQFHKRTRGYKTAALEAPISPPFTLVVTDCHGRKPIFPSPIRRQVALAILTSIASGPDALQLVLTEPVQVGEDQTSQVWKGTMSTTGSQNETYPADVMIKIYQESLYQDAPALCDLVHDGFHIEWHPGAYTAGREAWAYDRMEELQGRSVPWSYGFYKFLLPNGESAFGHVMELVDGLRATLPQAKASALGLDEASIWNLADELGRTLHDIHSCGVLHADLHPQNVLLVLKTEGEGYSSIQPVIVDFGLCLTVNDKDRLQSMLMREAEGIELVLREMDIPNSMISEWYQARLNNPPYWRTMFARRDDILRKRLKIHSLCTL
ncbi:hypothetical protein K439DRAFT_410342 [Ramaria rubella]|nr:hypothetical protein K439DRAFT_410342 [Ramaria rubella]